MRLNIARSVCLVACVSAAAWGQRLRGTVTDATGAALPGASVQLMAGERMVGQTRSGPDGRFVLNAAAGGEWTVLAVASGFVPAARTVKGEEVGREEVMLRLEVAPYRQALEIRASMEGHEEILDLSGVRESAAKDLGEALTAVDGVWKIRKAGIANDLVIRGFQQNNINVVVDGARIYAACPSHMDPPTQHVDFAEVEEVEISKGAFDVTRQGSLGALVNVVTKSPGVGLAVRPALSLGSFGFVNPSVTASYGTSAVRVLGGYSYRRSEAYKDGAGRRLTEYAGYSASGAGRRAFEINTGWGEADITLARRQRLSLRYTRQEAGLIPYPYLMMDSDYDNADRATLRYVAEEGWGGVRNVRVEGYFTGVNHFMSDTQRKSAVGGNWMMASDAGTRSAGGRVLGDVGRDVTVGVESYDRNWRVRGFMMAGAVSNMAIPDVNSRTLGAFVSWRRALGERLRLTAGARYDHASMHVQTEGASTKLYEQFHGTARRSNRDDYGSGNARLSYVVAKPAEVFAGVGTTGRIPDAEERYLSRGMGMNPMVGNPLLPITRNTEATAGWSLNGGRVSVRPAVFHSWLRDYIVVSRRAGGSAMARTYANVAARIYGGEMGWDVRLSEALSLHGGGSYSRGEATPDARQGVMSANLPEMPPLRGHGAVRYAYRWAYAEAGVVGVGRQSRVSGDLKEAPTAGYGLLNLKVGFTRGRVSGSFTLDNLTNRTYFEHLSFYRDPFSAGVKLPEPGRNAFVQVRYSF